MTLLELIDEVHEKCHAPKLEIYEIVTKAWPGTKEFKPVQARLLVNTIQRLQAGQPKTLSTDQIWGGS